MEDDENQLTPVITDDGYTFLYVKHNNLYRQRTGRMQGGEGGRGLKLQLQSGMCTIRVCTRDADSRSFHHRALAVVLSATASIL